MKKIILSLIAVMAIAFTASAENYRIDEVAVDNLIENAVTVLPLDLMPAAPAAAPSAAAFGSGTPNPVAALILDFFLGGFGIHRHYLGTKPIMWVLYTFTFGGIFGVVPLIDFVMLLIGVMDDDISQYIDNPSFFMWM